MVRTWKVTEKHSNKTDQRVSGVDQKLPGERDPGCSSRMSTCVGSGKGELGCLGVVVTGWMPHFPGGWYTGDLVQPLPGNRCTISYLCLNTFSDVKGGRGRLSNHFIKQTQNKKFLFFVFQSDLTVSSKLLPITLVVLTLADI